MQTSAGAEIMLLPSTTFHGAGHDRLRVTYGREETVPNDISLRTNKDASCVAPTSRQILVIWALGRSGSTFVGSLFQQLDEFMSVHTYGLRAGLSVACHRLAWGPFH